MGILQSSSSLQNTPSQGLAVVITRFLNQLLGQFNGNVEFKLNIKSSSLLAVSFVSANTNLVIPHDLGRIPVGYLVVARSAGFVVYNGTSTWSSEAMSLQATAIGSCQLYVI